jgi:hypothetical protein
MPPIILEKRAIGQAASLIVFFRFNAAIAV